MSEERREFQRCRSPNPQEITGFVTRQQISDLASILISASQDAIAPVARRHSSLWTCKAFRHDPRGPGGFTVDRAVFHVRRGGHAG